MIEKERTIEANHDKPAVKVVLLGNSGAGKSSLAQRFVYNKFNLYSESTIGASFFTKYMILDDSIGGETPNTTELQEHQRRQQQQVNKCVKFHVWDTAGQEKYHSLAPLYYRGASAAIIVYDICNAASFEALPTWLQRLQEFGPTTTTTTTKKDDFIRILVGNKCDLQNERQVLRERAESLALEFGCLYIESSAREDIHVEEIFQRIARLLPEDTMSCLAHDGSTGTSSRTSGGKNRSESFSNHGGIIKLAIQQQQQQQQQQQESRSFATIRQGVCGC